MDINANYVIDDLVKQVAKLSHEKAVLSALVMQKETERQQLKKELEQQSPAEK